MLPCFSCATQGRSQNRCEKATRMEGGRGLVQLAKRSTVQSEALHPMVQLPFATLKCSEKPSGVVKPQKIPLGVYVYWSEFCFRTKRVLGSSQSHCDFPLSRSSCSCKDHSCRYESCKSKYTCLCLTSACFRLQYSVTLPESTSRSEKRSNTASMRFPAVRLIDGHRRHFYDPCQHS